jgi:hypothetical protein
VSVSRSEKERERERERGRERQREGRTERERSEKGERTTKREFASFLVLNIIYLTCSDIVALRKLIDKYRKLRL